MIEEFPQRLVELVWALLYGFSIGLGVVAVFVAVGAVVAVVIAFKGPNPGLTSRSIRRHFESAFPEPKVEKSNKCPWCLNDHGKHRCDYEPIGKDAKR